MCCIRSDVIFRHVFLPFSFDLFSVQFYFQCRILATSRNLEIFQAAYGNVVPFRMMPSGFTSSETASFISLTTGLQNVDPDVLRRLHSLSAGLPAMVNIIAHLARDNADR